MEAAGACGLPGFIVLPLFAVVPSPLGPGASGRTGRYGQLFTRGGEVGWDVCVSKRFGRFGQTTIILFSSTPSCKRKTDSSDGLTSGGLSGSVQTKEMVPEAGIESAKAAVLRRRLHAAAGVTAGRIQRFPLEVRSFSYFSEY